MNPKPLELADDTTFFLAFCKLGEHTFLSLGSQNPNDKKTHTLCHVGKKIRHEKDYGCRGRTQTIFGYCDGVLGQDYKFRVAKDRNFVLDIEYQAYEISRAQYLQFIQSLKGLVAGKYQFTDGEKADHTLTPYYPNPEAPNTFVLTPIDQVPDLEMAPQYVGQDITQLGVRNNCRHTVISLVESFLPNGNTITQQISSFAYRKLAHRATYHNDVIENQFYVLPVPPQKEEMDPKQYRILSKLYQRLQTLPKIDPHSDETRNKFEAVKKLYRELQPAADQDLSLANILERIQTWSSENTDVIDHRRKRAVRSTATRKMLKEIERISTVRP